MVNDYRDEGATLGELCRIVGKKIWMVLGVTALVTIIASLLLIFCLNPYLREYTLQFSISYPSSETMKYPDGTPFNYNNLVEGDALRAAKESDARFAKVDVDKMIEEDDILITAETMEADGVLVYTGRYTVTVRGIYFSSATVAADFIRTIANAPVLSVKSMATEVDYRLDKDVFDKATFQDRLLLLTEQKEALLTEYDRLIELYRDNYTVSGKTLKNYRAELTTIYSDNTKQILEEELLTCGYELPSAAAAKIAELESERLLNEQKIAALKEAIASQENTSGRAARSMEQETNVLDSASTITISTTEGLEEMLVQLIVRNANIDYQISILQDEANLSAFESKLDAEFEKLDYAAETLKTVTVEIYDLQSYVAFDTSKAAVSGSVNAALGIVAALILAFLLVCIVVCAHDYPKYKKGLLKWQKSEKTESDAIRILNRQPQSQSPLNAENENMTDK